MESCVFSVVEASVHVIVIRKGCREANNRGRYSRRPLTMSSFTFSANTRCRNIDDDEQCGGCGWKCNCIACSTNHRPEELECQCACRFWIVVCCIVVIGFLLLFISSVVYRRTILYLLSLGALVISGCLLTASTMTSNCVWSAFFSIMMVFAFPCFYSCCWNHYSRRSDQNMTQPPTTTQSPMASSSRMELKPTSAVVMVFPDGETQLGVQESEMTEVQRGGTSEGNVQSSASNAAVV